MSGFTFRLFLESGEDIGSFATAVPNWKIGDESSTATMCVSASLRCEGKLVRRSGRWSGRTLFRLPVVNDRELSLTAALWAFAIFFGLFLAIRLALGI